MQKEGTESVKKNRKEVQIWPFPGFGSKGPNWGLKQGPEGSERDAAEWVLDLWSWCLVELVVSVSRI